MAHTVQAMDENTATLEMPPKPAMPNALGTELIMRPPADKPTKNIKPVM